MNYIADKIFMVRPVHFGYNPQTSESNAFQVKVDLSDEEVQSNALREFDAMVEKLKSFDVDVVVMEDRENLYTPDSIFPNNWFSTHINGTLCVYPMEAKARRFERNSRMIIGIKKNINFTRTLDFTGYEEKNKFLEGTGSLVIDHEHKLAYAAISSRTHTDAVDFWSNRIMFDVVKFHSSDESGKAVYHTNVMMCLGDKFAVICLESIKDEDEKKLVTETLHRTGREIIEISFEQMNSFAGNMLLIRNAKDEKLLVMSETARKSLDSGQIKKLESYAKIVSFDIDIIEKCGGGSVRCMIAELFNSRT